MVYSTNPDFAYQNEQAEEVKTLAPNQQDLIIRLERKDRGGKTVTLVVNFIGTAADCEALGKTLKSKCGTGGSVKDGEILVQGDVRKKVSEILKGLGYKVRGNIA